MDHIFTQMRQDRLVKVSKFLSLVLRHRPERIGIRLGAGGWVPVSELLSACKAHNFPLTDEELRRVVSSNEKQRFAFSPDGLLIRASQGHSVEIELGYEPIAPPAILYHGTAERFLASIKERGIVKGKRHHVHLSADPATATQVGSRHGRPMVLEIKAGLMHDDGFLFYLSDNGVWLTEHVPIRYISLIAP